MKLLCRLGWHEADRGEVYNDGYYFSSCLRCRRDMIRCGGAWQLVPEDHRVAWRSARWPRRVEPATFLPVLVPIPGFRARNAGGHHG